MAAGGDSSSKSRQDVGPYKKSSYKGQLYRVRFGERKGKGLTGRYLLNSSSYWAEYNEG